MNTYIFSTILNSVESFNCSRRFFSWNRFFWHIPKWVTLVSSNGMLSGFASDLGTLHQNGVLPRAQVYRHFKAFSERRESSEDEPHKRRLSSSRTDENIDTIRDLVPSDRWLTTKMMGEELNLTHTFVRFWSMNWGWDVCARWFQKGIRKTWLFFISRKRFLFSETFHLDVLNQTSRHETTHFNLSFKKARMSKSRIKCM